MRLNAALVFACFAGAAVLVSCTPATEPADLILIGKAPDAPVDTASVTNVHRREFDLAALDSPIAVLGARLFRENRMSNPGSQYLAACTSCHRPPDARPEPRAFADIEPRSLIPSSSDDMKNLTYRNTPTLLDAARADRFNWDGQFATLEETIKAKILGRQYGWTEDQRRQAVDEIHALILNDIGVGTSNDGQPYVKAFEAVYGIDLRNESGDVIVDAVVTALSDYVRLLTTVEGPPIEIDERAAKGLEIFMGRGNCAACHQPPLFTDYGFHNTGVAQIDPENAQNETDFKTPPLYYLHLTNPYMHNGQYATLEDAIRQKITASEMARAGTLVNPDPALLTMDITEEDVAPLAAFLRALHAGIASND